MGGLSRQYKGLSGVELTAEDLGAVKKSGDTMTGNLTFAAGKGVINNTPITESTTARTFSLTDAFAYIRFTNASASVATVPSNATVPFPIGTSINVWQQGGGVVSFAADVGVTINAISLIMSSQYKAATLIKVGTDEWDLVIG